MRPTKITSNDEEVVITASLGCFSTGINIRNIHNLILASPTKSQIRTLQSIGRSLRVSDDGRETNLYDICDDFSWKKSKNYTLRHAAIRVAMYEKEKFDYKLYALDIT